MLLGSCISLAGMVTTFAGGGSAGGTAGGRADGIGSAATFDNPYGVAVDSLGVVYVSDTGNKLVRKITPAGKRVLPRIVYCMCLIVEDCS